MLIFKIYFQAAYANEHFEIKRKKLEIKLESDNANDDFGFPETMNRRERKEVSHRLVYILIVMSSISDV